MKKLFVFVLACVLLLSFSSCINKGDTVNEPTSADIEETTEKNASEDSAAEGTSSEKTTAADEEDASESTGSVLLPVSADGMSFSFLSGAGGWSSDITVFPDGRFSGSYHDSELGSVGEEYPDGTIYVCNFTGTFSDVEKINGYSYSMKLSDVSLEYTEGDEWIEDGVRYVASGPHGIEGGDEFIFYLPEAPVSELSEDFLSWWPLRYDDNASSIEKLTVYGIRNLATDNGFFSN